MLLKVLLDRFCGKLKYFITSLPILKLNVLLKCTILCYKSSVKVTNPPCSVQLQGMPCRSFIKPASFELRWNFSRDKVIHQINNFSGFYKYLNCDYKSRVSFNLKILKLINHKYFLINFFSKIFFLRQVVHVHYLLRSRFPRVFVIVDLVLLKSICLSQAKYLFVSFSHPISWRLTRFDNIYTFTYYKNKIFEYDFLWNSIYKFLNLMLYNWTINSTYGLIL